MRLTNVILPLLLVISGCAADIRSDLRDFYNLIPRGRVALLAGRHFLFDPSFRTAWNYMRSTSFEALLRDKVSKNPDVRRINEYLGWAIDLTMIPRIIRRYDLRPPPAEAYGGVRTLSSFIQEVSDLMPDDRITKLMQEKRATSSEFATFSNKIMSRQYRTLVYKARNSKSLAGAFKTMKMHQVDVDQILELFFKKMDEWTT